MTRAVKEMLKYSETDMSRAARIAEKCGYEVDVYDGDGECGMCAPEMSFRKKEVCMKKIDTKKVDEYVESFKLEYPEYNDEMVSDYIQLLDDWTAKEKDYFAMKLGY
jgi:hypothetical protein